MCACKIQARQQADSTQAEVSRAAGQAAAAWAEVDAMESKGDAAGAATSAAEAVALQQQAQQRQAAASAAAAQAQQQVHILGRSTVKSPCPFSLSTRVPLGWPKSHPTHQQKQKTSVLGHPSMPCTRLSPLRLLHMHTMEHISMMQYCMIHDCMIASLVHESSAVLQH